MSFRARREVKTMSANFLHIFMTVSFLYFPTLAFFESSGTLDELPLLSLLKKRSVVLEITQNRSEGSEGPVAAALINPLQHMQVRKGEVDRGHYDVEEMEEDESDEEWTWMSMMPKGKGKLSGIFDTSVTALSFLAFGGYLICMIFNCVKQNNSTTEATQLYQQLLSQSQSQYQKPGYAYRPTGRRRRSDPGYGVNLSEADSHIDSGYLLVDTFFFATNKT